jgi:PAS domain S-box-containing protein
VATMKKSSKTKKTKPKDAKSLRDRAETLLRENPPDIPKEDLAALLHELQVHQIELQMQNEELREAHERLEESRNRYYELYDFAPVGYITMTASGVIQESNLAAADMFGMVRSRFLNNLFQGFILPDDLHLFENHRRRLFDSKTNDTCELRLRNKDHVFFCRVESAGGKDHQGNMVNIRSALIDITATKKAEEELRRANEGFAAIAENARDIISRRERDLRCTYVNPAIEALTGIPRRELLGKTFDETGVGFPDQIRKAVAEVIRSGQEKTVEFEHDTSEGIKTFHALAIPEKDREGTVKSVLTIARDIPGLKGVQKTLENSVREKAAEIEQANLKLVEEIRKREKFEKVMRASSEQIIQEAQKRQMLSARLVDLLEKDRRSTAMALHDHLGQLLTTIKMDLEMMEGAGEKDARALIHRAKQRIGEALQFSRDAVNQLRPASLDTLGLVSSMEALIQDIAKSTNDISISFFSRPLPSGICKDKELALYRVAQESITNALKHASPGNVFVNLMARNETVILTIEDDGKGFDYTQTIASPQAAMGIGIMQERLFLVGGRLKIESQPGKGTQVIAEVPV